MSSVCREEDPLFLQGRKNIVRTPKIAADTNPRWAEHLKMRSAEMEGKTVKKVLCGMREPHVDLHQSEVLQLEFTDGSILYIETASNVQNVMHDVNSGRKASIKASDFHADLWLTWVDPHSDE